MPKKVQVSPRRKVYGLDTGGDAATGRWLFDKFGEDALLSKVRGPKPRHLFIVSGAELKEVERERYKQELKYRTWWKWSDEKVFRRDYDRDRFSPKQRVANETGRQLNRFKGIKTRVIRKHLALAE